MIEWRSLGAFEIVLAVLGILGIFSAFLFNKAGRITHRTVLVNYGLFVALAILLWVYMAVRDPSVALGGGLCIGGLLVLMGLYEAALYWVLPRVHRWQDRRR